MGMTAICCLAGAMLERGFCVKWEMGIGCSPYYFGQQVGLIN
jgi:hypothetical protein